MASVFVYKYVSTMLCCLGVENNSGTMSDNAPDFGFVEKLAEIKKFLHSNIPYDSEFIDDVLWSNAEHAKDVVQEYADTEIKMLELHKQITEYEDNPPKNLQTIRSVYRKRLIFDIYQVLLPLYKIKFFASIRFYARATAEIQCYLERKVRDKKKPKQDKPNIAAAKDDNPENDLETIIPYIDANTYGIENIELDSKVDEKDVRYNLALAKKEIEIAYAYTMELLSMEHTKYHIEKKLKSLETQYNKIVHNEKIYLETYASRRSISLQNV